MDWEAENVLPLDSARRFVVSKVFRTSFVRLSVHVDEQPIYALNDETQKRLAVSLVGFVL